MSAKNGNNGHENGKKINLFDYRDYRLFLKDWYTAAKETRSSFSYRVFSRKAGFKSTNFLKLVMDGDRDLTPKSLTKFIVGLRLNKQEAEFFENLVFFNQAENHEEKNHYYRALLQTKKLNQLKLLEESQYEYYATWYHNVVRELIASKEFNGKPEWIAERVSPSITPSQAKKSIELLEILGLIEKGDGNWKQTHSLVSTGPEVRSFAVMNYHREMLEVSKEVLRTVPAKERDFSILTLGIQKSQLPEIKKLIQEMRRAVLKMVSDVEDVEEVIQLNIQMFPVTKFSKEEDGEK